MAKKFANSLCETQGHVWRLTTSRLYRICTREKCKAAERLDGKRWICAPRNDRVQHHTLAQQVNLPQQLDLLDAYKASSPLEIDLYSSEEIRQAELSYYRLLGR